MKNYYLNLPLMLLLSGCGLLGVEIQPQTESHTSSRQEKILTPLERCLNDVNYTVRGCTLSALGSGRSFNDAIAQKNVQICDDRKISQEDRCYSRFK